MKDPEVLAWLCFSSLGSLLLQVMWPLMATRGCRAVKASSCFLNSSFLPYIPASSQMDSPPSITVQMFLNVHLGAHLCTHWPFSYRESLISKFICRLSVFSQDLIGIPTTLTQTTGLGKQLGNYSGETWKELSQDNIYNDRRYTFWIITPQMSKKKKFKKQI